MTEDDKRKSIEKYFMPFPKWGIWMLLLGLAIAGIGSDAGAVPILVGLALAAIGAYGLWSFKGGKASDEEMDQYFEEDLKAVTNQMLKKIGMDENELVGESQHVYGPGYGSGNDAAKIGKDGKLRYNPVRCASIGFGENQLLFYSTDLDITTGKMLKETTDEYFYKDVVSASTKTDTQKFEWKGEMHQFNSAEIFTLTTSGGTSVNVFLKDPELASVMGVGKVDISTSGAEQAVQVIRRMLRDKK